MDFKNNASSLNKARAITANGQPGKLIPGRKPLYKNTRLIYDKDTTRKSKPSQIMPFNIGSEKFTDAVLANLNDKALIFMQLALVNYIKQLLKNGSNTAIKQKISLLQGNLQLLELELCRRN